MQATPARNNQPRLSASPAGYLLALVIGLVATSPLQAADADLIALKGSLVDAKLAGVCGVMRQMASFQETTQMAGGAEFFMRFWRTEFARLGLSQEDFLQTCLRVTSRHTKVIQSLEDLEK